jgi:hypothetical protein
MEHRIRTQFAHITNVESWFLVQAGSSLRLVCGKISLTAAEDSTFRVTTSGGVAEVAFASVLAAGVVENDGHRTGLHARIEHAYGMVTVVR